MVGLNFLKAMFALAIALFGLALPARAQATQAALESLPDAVLLLNHRWRWHWR
jgi:hypothetical protein